MQKTNKKAYILLWSVFLSLIISISFISISANINKKIKSNSSSSSEFIINKELNSEIKSEIKESRDIDSTYSIVFSDPRVINKSIKKNEVNNFLSKTGANIDLRLAYEGAIHYELNGNYSSSGVVTDYISFSSFSGTILLKNLGGYNQIELESSENIFGEQSYYKLEKNIGNKKTIKQSGFTNNF